MTRLKYSDVIIPVSILANLVIINSILFLLTPSTYLHGPHILYYNSSWVIITLALKYYATERKETFRTNEAKMIYVFIIYGLAYFALFGIMGSTYNSFFHQIMVLLTIYAALIWYRLLFFWLRKKYRTLGGNSVKLVVLGRDANLKKIRKVFDKPYHGYHYEGYFDDDLSPSPTYLGKIEDCFLYILNNNIEEIFCVASRFNQKGLQNLITFADNNLIRFNIILDNKEIFSRAMNIESFENVPVLNLRKVPLDTAFARIAKRLFDLAVSTTAIIVLLSWLTPLLYVIIKLDSPGPLFFKQGRHGLKRRLFMCYKFRSMVVNNGANEKMASKNDTRTTKIGRFIRKTSIDELPQFFNVFLGDMSVVGPRPHMELHTWDYETSIDKYLVRHFVKPGITGLAQVSGYRGEIKKKEDILNRVRLDIFYVEKWSVRMDFWILIKTIMMLFTGDKRAY